VWLLYACAQYAAEPQHVDAAPDLDKNKMYKASPPKSNRHLMNVFKVFFLQIFKRFVTVCKCACTVTVNY
jgi:hypothetical protein